MLTCLEFVSREEAIIDVAVTRLESLHIKLPHPQRLENVVLWTELNAHFQEMSPKIFTQLVQRRLAMADEYVKRILEFKALSNDPALSLAQIEILSKQCEHYERHFPTSKDMAATCPSAVAPQVTERLEAIYSWRNTFYLLSSFQKALDADEREISRVILGALTRMNPVEFTSSYFLVSLRKTVLYAQEACNVSGQKWTELGLPDLTKLAQTICRCKFDTIRHCIDEQVKIAEEEKHNTPINNISHHWYLICALANLCSFYERMYGEQDELVLETKRVGVDRVDCLARCMHKYIAPTDPDDAFRMISREAPYRHWQDLTIVLGYFPGAGELMFSSFCNTISSVSQFLIEHTQLLGTNLGGGTVVAGPDFEKFHHYSDRVREITRRLYHSKNQIYRYCLSLDQPEGFVLAITKMENSLTALCESFMCFTTSMFGSPLFVQHPEQAYNVIQVCIDSITSVLFTNHYFDSSAVKLQLTPFCNGIIHSPSFRNRSLRVSCKRLFQRCLDVEGLAYETVESLSRAWREIESERGHHGIGDFAAPLRAIPAIEECIMVRRREAGLAGRVIPSTTLLKPTTIVMQYMQDSVPVGFIWQKLCKLGEGPCGIVYNAISQSTQGIVAVKEIFINDSFDATAFKSAMEQNVRLRDNHILKYYGYERKKERVSIVTEHCGAASLCKILQMGPIEDVDLLKTYCLQILLGLAFLHSNGVVHKNLKPENVLMESNGTVKLCDFGNMIPIVIRNKTVITGVGSRKNRRNLFGSPEFMAPELLIGENFGTSADLWSFACLVLFMLTGKRPFEDLESDRSVLYNVTVLKRDPYIPACLGGRLRAIVNGCFSRDPLARPTTKELLDDPFFANVPVPCSE